MLNVKFFGANIAVFFVVVDSGQRNKCTDSIRRRSRTSTSSSLMSTLQNRALTERISSLFRKSTIQTTYWQETVKAFCAICLIRIIDTEFGHC